MVLNGAYLVEASRTEELRELLGAARGAPPRVRRAARAGRALAALQLRLAARRRHEHHHRRAGRRARRSRRSPAGRRGRARRARSRSPSPTSTSFTSACGRLISSVSYGRDRAYRRGGWGARCDRAVRDRGATRPAAAGRRAAARAGVRRPRRDLRARKHDEPEITEDALWRHEQIVEAVMETRDLLPMRYGTRFAARRGGGRRGGRRASGTLQAALERVRGAVELSLRVRAREPGVSADVHASLRPLVREADDAPRPRRG